MMKSRKLFFIVAILGPGLFISFTPENIEDRQSEPPIERLLVPRQG
jgi:hypothetical protein